MSAATPAFPINLTANELLLRALRSKAEQEDKRRAFLLRNNERDSGLSVSYNCTPDECENAFKKIYGVLSLLAQQVMALDLPVVADEPTHANIKNVPHQDDDPNRAMAIAGQLSGLAVTIRGATLRHNLTHEPHFAPRSARALCR